MPFRSKAQARYMFSQHPQIAKEFAAATPSIKKLPNKVKQPKVRKSKAMTVKMAKVMPMQKLEAKLTKKV